MPFTDFNNKINALATFDTEEEIRKIVIENSEILIEMVKGQMILGKDAYGKPTKLGSRDYYHPETLANKARVSGPGGITSWITNYMLGDFYRFLSLEFRGDNFVITSDVEYFPEIIARSGEDIVKVSKENLIKFRNDIIIPQLMKRLKQRMNGI